MPGKVYSGASDLQDRRGTVYRSPRMIVEFAMHRAGIADIAVSAPVKAVVLEVASFRAMPYAISISPRGRTLEYVASWRVNETTTIIAGMRRVAAKLINVSDHAAAVEWHGRNPHAAGYGILGKTLAHLHGISAAVTVNQASSGTKGRAFNAAQHPRGSRGRFIPKAVAEQLKRQAAAAARNRQSKFKTQTYRRRKPK